MHDMLTRLAILYGTDKFGYHDYTPNYFKLFKHLREAPVRVLEIGVGGYADDDRGGQSLEVWRDFFENGEITGIDIQKKSMDLGPRVRILQGSQVDADFLAELVAECGPFDIIIDDGSHRNEHIVESYKLLFTTLAPGGIYVVEDVQTSFHPRFGGSLTLEEPNSIGFFGWLLQQLNAGSEDPLIRDVASMERFHNMIALHKRTADGPGRDVFASNRFELFEGRHPNITVLGMNPAFDIATLSIAVGEVRHTDFQHADAEKAVEGADIVLCTLGVPDELRQERFEQLFSGMNEGGVFILSSLQPDIHFGPQSPLMAYAKHRFTMVDHVEIKVHYPDAEIDVLADRIYSMERYEDALLFYKSPNSYPSNFAFDATNAQAARALAQMGEVLKDATSEGGLVQYADLLTRYISRMEAREVLARLEGIGATSRRYFQMAGALAQKDKDLGRAEQLFSAALARFPKDPQFCALLSGTYSARGELDQAEAVLREAYEVNPRSRAIVTALSRVAAMQGKLTEAIELAQTSINLFPKQARPQRLVILSQLLRSDDQFDAALEVLSKADALEEGRADVLAERAEVERALSAKEVHT